MTNRPVGNIDRTSSKKQTNTPLDTDEHTLMTTDRPVGNVDRT